MNIQSLVQGYWHPIAIEKFYAKISFNKSSQSSFVFQKFVAVVNSPTSCLGIHSQKCVYARCSFMGGLGKVPQRLGCVNYASYQKLYSTSLPQFSNSVSLTVLQERAVDPTLPGLFPDTDWLIGNHSDELTPWIPVMAARFMFI